MYLDHYIAISIILCYRRIITPILPYRNLWYVPGVVHPASNGLAEKAVQIIKLEIPNISGGSLGSRLYKFLLQYHVTPQATTKEASCVLLNKRLLRTPLDLVKPDIVENVQESQSKMKIKHEWRPHIDHVKFRLVSSQEV